MILVMCSRNCPVTYNYARAFHDTMKMPKELIEFEIVKNTNALGSCDAMLLFCDRGTAMASPAAKEFVGKLKNVPIILMIEGPEKAAFEENMAELIEKDNILLEKIRYSADDTSNIKEVIKQVKIVLFE